MQRRAEAGRKEVVKDLLAEVVAVGGEQAGRRAAAGYGAHAVEPLPALHLVIYDVCVCRLGSSKRRQRTGSESA